MEIPFGKAERGALIAGNANKATLAKPATANLIVSFIVFLPFCSLSEYPECDAYPEGCTVRDE